MTFDQDPQTPECSEKHSHTETSLTLYIVLMERNITDNPPADYKRIKNPRKCPTNSNISALQSDWVSMGSPSFSPITTYDIRFHTHLSSNTEIPYVKEGLNIHLRPSLIKCLLTFLQKHNPPIHLTVPKITRKILPAK